MTKAQEKAIARIRKMAENTLFFGTNKDDYEFKEWEVSENEYFVNVVLEVGRKGDEGTMAAIFARDRAQLFVGKRGGITYPKTIRDKDGNYKDTRTVSLGNNGILKAVIDQR